MSIRNLDHRPRIEPRGYSGHYDVRCHCAPGIAIPFGSLDEAVASILFHVAEGEPYPGRYSARVDDAISADAA